MVKYLENISIRQYLELVVFPRTLNVYLEIFAAEISSFDVSSNTDLKKLYRWRTWHLTYTHETYTGEIIVSERLMKWTD